MAQNAILNLVVALIFSFTAVPVIMANTLVAGKACKPTDRGPVIPTNPLVTFLELVQKTAYKTYGHKGFDPKLYVDLSLKNNLSITIQEFHKLPRTENGSVPVKELNSFIEKHFGDSEEDLVHVKPVDFVPEPKDFLPKVKSPEMRAWALQVHSLWSNLNRKVSKGVFHLPDYHTLLPLKSPVIIPGSRFREVYYWDSYWVISQPPLLSSMVIDIYDRTGDKELVAKSLPALLKEHDFWNSGIHKVIIEDAEGSSHALSRYYAMWNKPRPESSTTDRETASKLSNTCEKKQLYRELASTAESGWDFSTRWMRNGFDLTTLATTSIIPVDLNAFILKMELDISSLSHSIGDSGTAEFFRKASEARKKAITSILWNAEMGQWVDYWLGYSNDVITLNGSSQDKKIFASNFVPLWIQPFGSDAKIADKVISSLQTSGLVHSAGIATSLTNSGQQWDFPNGWAPLQHMIVEGLVRCGSEKARAIAQDIAVKWIRTNYVAFKKTGTMHEKYDVRKCGDVGEGGEYTPQTGFGWSNGVVLAFLEEFGWPKDLKLDCP